MDADVDIELPPLPRSARQARAELAALEHHAHPETIARARLLVSELVTAAVVAGSDAPIGLRVRVADGRVRAEVRREGVAAALPRGWAHLLVQRLAQAWGVLPDGTVWFEVGDRHRFTSLA